MTADPNTDPEAKQFQANIRKYNSLLQMASSGINIASPQQGISMLAITGGIYHMLPTGLSSLRDFAARADFIVERAILTPLNEDVDLINKKVMNMFAYTDADGRPAASRCVHTECCVPGGVLSRTGLSCLANTHKLPPTRSRGARGRWR
jgi:hypothetical protein